MHFNGNTETQAIIHEVSGVISPVYLVGGSVRDSLLGRTPQDYDFTTPLDPEAIEQAIRAAGMRPYLVGKRYGTVGFKLNSHFIEVTTFRTERYTRGSRKPEVEFTHDITYDLSRRDFTINAMALRDDGHVIDPFGGLSDLRDHIIRTVNKPYDRYNEDPLRMLRAARLASQLDFSVDTDSEKQAAKKAYQILEVSKERWTLELDKLLMTDHPTSGLEFLAMTRLLHFTLPELAVQIGYDQRSPYHQLDLWRHTLRTVELSPQDLHVRWAALLHDIGKPYVQVTNSRGYSNYTHHDVVGAEIVGKIASYLKWSNERTAAIQSLVRDHLHDDSPIGKADAAARFVQ
jgi:putative nucleotidyltransferase with HDIG domain